MKDIIGFDITTEKLHAIVMAAITVGIVIIVTYLLAFIVQKWIMKKASRQTRMLARKTIVYTGVLIAVFYLLRTWGVQMSAILGAAGVVGLVVGIASQTSIGNIISGLFLISEKAFEIGDVIRIDDKTGVVYSIDLLSIKIRTFDNLIIRIPNQKVISSDLTNITRMPIRRLDFKLSVAYKEDLTRVKSILEEIAHDNELCLEEPEPLIVFEQFGDHGIHILFAVWFEKSNFLKVKNAVFLKIKQRFDEEGIEIPFPHLSLYRGEASKPFQFGMLESNSKTE